MAAFHELPFDLAKLRIELMKRLARISSGYADEKEVGTTSVEYDDDGRVQKIIRPTMTEEILEYNSGGQVVRYQKIYVEQALEYEVLYDSEGRLEEERLVE